MIRLHTRLKVVDNSGGKEIMCIRVIGTNRQYATLGDVIIGVVKNAVPNMPVRKSDIVRAVVVRVKKTVNRKNFFSVRFDDNAAVLISADGNPKGTRIFGPVARELRDKNFTKIASLAQEVV